MASNRHARVREILDRTEQDLRDCKIDCTTMIDEGDPADVLTQLTEECGADVLVIGNRGMHRRVLGRGPKASRTRRRAPCLDGRSSIKCPSPARSLKPGGGAADARAS
jgi:nucleotide-binding universal stress UspA family protein